MFPPWIERWRSIAAIQSHGVPPDLTLAFIMRESNGAIGSYAKKDSPSSYTEDEIRSCGFPSALRRRDAGLMQITPGTFRAYVDATGDPVSPCVLLEKSERAAHMQIRIGTWVLARALAGAVDLSEELRGRSPASLWPSSSPPAEQILTARLINGYGYSGTARRMDAAAARGFPHTFAGLEASGAAPARLYQGARLILGWFNAGGDRGAPIAGGRAPLPWDWTGEELAARRASSSRRSSSPASSGDAGGLVLLAGAALLALGAYRSRSSRSSSPAR